MVEVIRIYSNDSSNGKKVNQSHYRPEVPRGFQEVKVPTLLDNIPPTDAILI